MITIVTTTSRIRLPDLSLATGTITITPNSEFEYIEDGEPVLIGAVSRVATFTDGVLDAPIELAPTLGADHDREGIFYTAKFEFKDGVRHLDSFNQYWELDAETIDDDVEITDIDLAAGTSGSDSPAPATTQTVYAWATAALQSAGNAILTAIKLKTDNIPAQGQAVAAASLPVVIPVTQVADIVGTDITTPTAMPAGGAGLRGWLSAIYTKLSDAIAVTVAALPLPTGAATEAKQDTTNSGIVALGVIDQLIVDALALLAKKTEVQPTAAASLALSATAAAFQTITDTIAAANTPEVVGLDSVTFNTITFLPYGRAGNRTLNTSTIWIQLTGADASPAMPLVADEMASWTFTAPQGQKLNASMFYIDVETAGDGYLAVCQ